MRARTTIATAAASAAWTAGLIYAWAEVGAGALVIFALLGFFLAFGLTRLAR